MRLTEPSQTLAEAVAFVLMLAAVVMFFLVFS